MNRNERKYAKATKKNNKSVAYVSHTLLLASLAGYDLLEICRDAIRGCFMAAVPMKFS